MRETAFIVTVDTEGDDLWARPRTITTRNACFLPRFQALCERHGLRPVYLANYEMVQCPAFVEFGLDLLARDAGEIGMHLHAWNSPPIEPLTGDDFRHQPYLIEYPDPVMREKIKVMTQLLEDRFDTPIVSHRAGRWAFDARYATMLAEAGYRVDCSVTPGVDWRTVRGAPGGDGGSDYSACPNEPYVIGANGSPAPPAAPGLLEVPMTVRRASLARRAGWVYRAPLLRKVANRLAPRLRWLCPVPLLEARNLDAMLEVGRAAVAERPTHLEFMIHSSELMPGGSPSFKTASDIDRLYSHLERLFGEVAALCHAATLKEFAAAHAARPARCALAPA